MNFQIPLFQAVKQNLKNPMLKKCLFSSTYQSSISLKKLYPESTLSITSPVKLPENEKLKFNGFIPIDKLNIICSRSSGPGGQNVNKVNTKVDIRFNLANADWLHEDIKAKLSEKHKSRINKDGYFCVKSEKTRYQIYNKADAITILREMIFAAAQACIVHEPSPETFHILRKRKELSNSERLAQKSEHSLKKTSRKTPDIS